MEIAANVSFMQAKDRHDQAAEKLRRESLSMQRNQRELSQEIREAKMRKEAAEAAENAVNSARKALAGRESLAKAADQSAARAREEWHVATQQMFMERQQHDEWLKQVRLEHEKAKAQRNELAQLKTETEILNEKRVMTENAIAALKAELQELAAEKLRMEMHQKELSDAAAAAEARLDSARHRAAAEAEAQALGDEHAQALVLREESQRTEIEIAAASLMDVKETSSRSAGGDNAFFSPEHDDMKSKIDENLGSPTDNSDNQRDMQASSTTMSKQETCVNEAAVAYRDAVSVSATHEDRQTEQATSDAHHLGEEPEGSAGTANTVTGQSLGPPTANVSHHQGNPEVKDRHEQAAETDTTDEGTDIIGALNPDRDVEESDNSEQETADA